MVNWGQMDIGQDLSLDDGSWANYGALLVSRDLLINSNSVRFCNFDSVQVYRDFDAQGEVQNNGLFQVDSTYEQSNGSFCVESASILRSEDLTFSGTTVEGPSSSGRCASFEVESSSSVDATMGISGPVDFCDSTPPASSPYLDSYSGSLGTNVSYCACTVVLPARVYLRWEAYRDPQGVWLRAVWPTEQPIEDLQVARSRDGRHFQVLPEASAFPLSPGYWQGLDAHPPAGSPLYYRLRYRDGRGQVYLSSVLRVGPAKQQQQREVRLLGASAQAWLQWRLTSTAPMVWELLDGQGRRVWRKQVAPGALVGRMALPAAPVPSGLYFLRVQQDGWQQLLPWIGP